MDKLGWAAAMVLEHARSLLNMDTCFLLKLEGYGDVRSELGSDEGFTQRGKLSMKASLEKRIPKSEND